VLSADGDVAACGQVVSALASELPKRNGWTIAQHAGDRSPDRAQRLLNRASWDALAAISEVRRFAAAGDFLQLTGALWRAASGPEDRSQPMLGLIIDGLTTREQR
jgi:hypothetical protein